MQLFRIFVFLLVLFPSYHSNAQGGRLLEFDGTYMDTVWMSFYKDDTLISGISTVGSTAPMSEFRSDVIRGDEDALKKRDSIVIAEMLWYSEYELASTETWGADRMELWVDSSSYENGGYSVAMSPILFKQDGTIICGPLLHRHSTPIIGCGNHIPETYMAFYDRFGDISRMMTLEVDTHSLKEWKKLLKSEREWSSMFPAMSYSEYGMNLAGHLCFIDHVTIVDGAEEHDTQIISYTSDGISGSGSVSYKRSGNSMMVYSMVSESYEVDEMGNWTMKISTEDDKVDTTWRTITYLPDAKPGNNMTEVPMTPAYKEFMAGIDFVGLVYDTTKCSATIDKEPTVRIPVDSAFAAEFYRQMYDPFAYTHPEDLKCHDHEIRFYRKKKQVGSLQMQIKHNWVEAHGDFPLEFPYAVMVERLVEFVKRRE